MPASTSSKTSVGVASAAARTPLMASATRDSSPPDAMRANGRGCSPGLGASTKRDGVGAGEVQRRRQQLHRERAVREAQLPERGGDLRAEAFRRRVPGPRQRLCRVACLALQPLRRGLAACPLPFQPAQPVRLRPRPLAVRQDGLLVVAVLAQQPVERRRAAPPAARDRRRPPPIRRAAAPQLRRDVLDLGLQAQRGAPPGPASRSSSRASSAASRAASASWSRAPLPSPASRSWTCADSLTRRSALLAAASRARSASTSPGCGAAASISAAACSASSRRRASSPGVELQLAQRGLVLAPRLHGLADGRHQRRVPAVRVQQVALRAAAPAAAAGRAGRGSRRARRPSPRAARRSPSRRRCARSSGRSRPARGRRSAAPAPDRRAPRRGPWPRPSAPGPRPRARRAPASARR